jgi:anaerobic selenocysteine-containing dehydrogenase
MLRIARLLKFEALIIVARHSAEQKEAVIYLNPEFAKRSGIKEGDIVSVVKGDRRVNLKVKLLDTAPEDGGIIPNSIFASYLSDFQNFKSFRAYIEIAEGGESKVEDILKIVMDRK